MKNKIIQILQAARHELTTLHNLTVTDNVESGRTWQTDTNQLVSEIDKAISELLSSENRLS